MMTDWKRPEDVTGVVLAGGKSRRMGRDKAVLHVSGRTLFDINLAMMEGLFNRVVIAGNRPDLARQNVSFIPDIYPGSSLGGLYTALFSAVTEFIMVSACDMPFPDERNARIMVSLREGFDVVVPVPPYGFEPLFAVYRKTCLPYMEALLEGGNYRIYDFYPQVRVRRVQVHELSGNWEKTLMNVNRPEEYLRVKEYEL
jgi:molybdopterin-guanine dinucleotide biosynthesis protein A